MLLPGVYTLSYTTGKYAVVGMSNALRTEAAAYNVRVSAVCPGVIDTLILRTRKLLNLDSEKLMNSLLKLYAPEKCARDILRGIQRDQATIVITSLAKLTWVLHRISHGITEWAMKNKDRKPSDNARLDQEND